MIRDLQHSSVWQKTPTAGKWLRLCRKQSMPVRADKDAQKSEKTGAEEEKTILGKLYVAGIGPGSLGWNDKRGL